MSFGSPRDGGEDPRHLDTYAPDGPHLSVAPMPCLDRPDPVVVMAEGLDLSDLLDDG